MSDRECLPFSRSENFDILRRGFCKRVAFEIVKPNLCTSHLDSSLYLSCFIAVLFIALP